MCEPTTIAMAAMAIGGALSAKAQYNQGQVQAGLMRNNATMAEYAAQDAMRRGDEEAAKVRRQGDQIKGAQRAKMAAAGLDLEAGTAGELQDQVDFFSQMDQNTARSNAKRDAWALREQAKGYGVQGAAAEQQGTLGAFSTILATGGQVAGKWYANKPSTATRG